MKKFYLFFIRDKMCDNDVEFAQLLDKLYTRLELCKNTTDSSKKLVIPPPQRGKEGKKTIWANFEKTCNILNRPMAHFQKFINAETGQTTSIDQENRLVIKGMYTNKHFENILMNYVAAYVKCRSCGSCRSDLNDTLIVCQSCHAETSTITK